MRTLSTLLALAFVTAGCADREEGGPDPHTECFHLYEPGVDGQALVKTSYLPSGPSPPTPEPDATTVTIEGEGNSTWSQLARTDAWGCALIVLPSAGPYHAFAQHIEDEHCQWYDGSRFDFNGTGSVRLIYTLDYYCFNSTATRG